MKDPSTQSTDTVFKVKVPSPLRFFAAARDIEAKARKHTRRMMNFETAIFVYLFCICLCLIF
jgi:hypothetical protein